MDTTLGKKNISAIESIPASYNERFLAIAIDWLVLAGFLFFMRHFRVGSHSIQLYGSILFFMIYKPFMEYYWGATLGKLLFKIKVIDRQGLTPNIKKVLLRNLVGICQDLYKIIVSILHFNPSEQMHLSKFKFQNPYGDVIWIIVLVYFFDILYMLNSKKNRCLHDKWAGTMVAKRA